MLLDGGELWLERGEHVSLVGPNGSGKTTLIEALAGHRELGAPREDGGPVVTGKLLTGHNVTIGFLSQHAEELTAGPHARTVLEATQHATGLTPNKARALLGRFLFSGEEAEKPLDGLSGGERRRLSLAVLVHSGANVLILDEPTNHLDLDSREALEQALSAFPGSLVLISHDRALLDAVGTRTVAFERRRTASRRCAPTSAVGRSTSAPARSAPRSRAPSRRNPAARRTPPAKDRARSDGHASRSGKGSERAQQQLEERIEQAEQALRSLEDELADPGAWGTKERAAEATSRHEQAKRELDRLMEEWELLAG